MRRPAPTWARPLLLLALLALFAGLKAQHEIHWTQGRDGRFYADIARQVMDGQGLTTRISNWNQGFREWPARTNMSPLWLLAHGYAARVIGFEAAAQRLPQLLFLIDLLLLYFLANRVWLRVVGRPPGGIAGSGLPDLGHVAVLLFGANAIFFRFTSLPMTEGLAFATTFGALLALDRAAGSERADRRAVGWAALAGGVAMLALLTRGQLLAVPVAVLGGLVIAGLRPGGWRLPAAGAAAGALVLAPWVAWLATWVPTVTPPIVLGFGQIQESIGLPSLTFFVETDTLGAYLADRWGGVVTAFDPWSENSYFASHGWPVLLAPLAGVAVLAGLAREPGRLRRWLAPPYALPWTCVALGFGSLLPVHHAHSVLWGPWFFGYRHGLPFLYLLLPALAWWLARPQPALRLAAAAVVAIGALQAGSRVLAELPGESKPILLPGEREVGRWLDERDADPIVLYWDPTRIPLVSRNAFVHWTACDQPPEALERLIEDAGVEYVLVRRFERGCSFHEIDGLHPVHQSKPRPFITVYATKNAARGARR